MVNAGRDIFYVIDRMKDKLGQLAEEEHEKNLDGDKDSRIKQHCYTLLRDAIWFTEPRLHELPATSLIELIDLTSEAVREDNPDKQYYRGVKKKLVDLGFDLVPNIKVSAKSVDTKNSAHMRN